ncbi:MAG: LuxR C-terminal-related transcriptional regulator [Anaerolineae bacterium]
MSLQTVPEALNSRAVEILQLLAEGLSDREIADRLYLTINTVKWYNRQIYSILGVGSRTQAIARAHELQLLDAEKSAPFNSAAPAALSSNLPAETTRFIGRARERAAIIQMLETVHLLTLVGPPGTGKTRLAITVGRETTQYFPDGVYFISLAPISDPALVVYAIATALGVTETIGQPVNKALKQFLRPRYILLILDNFEHLLVAAPEVSELLAAAPHLKVMATSREPLHLYGEHEYAVPPLDLPDFNHLNPRALADCESTALFMQHARAVRSDFELTPENAADIAQICMRLEGLPLAIELAAARSKLLSPRALLDRLENRLDTLTGGAQDLPARQRTLRNTIEWSYNLLDDGERTLFARLGIFHGGCSLEAVEAVCGDNLPMDVFDGLESLVNKSLIQQKELPGGESRFVMLETLHEYALEQLLNSGEAPTIYRQHAEFFVQLAEHAEPELRRGGFTYWMNRLENEYSNLLIALEWSLGDGDAELGLRLVATLRDFWVMSDRYVQAQNWAQRALTKSTNITPDVRIRVLLSAGLTLFYGSREHQLQQRLLGEAVELARATDDKLNLAWACIFRAVTSIGHADEYEEAVSTAEQGLSLFRTLDFKPGMAQALNIIGELTRVQGDDDWAQRVYEECLDIVRRSGELRREAMILNNMGCILMHQADYQRAETLFKTALSQRIKVGHDKRGCLTNILYLAGAIAATGHPERAARLFGASYALLESIGVELEPGDKPEHERDLSFVRAHLNDQTFNKHWNEGRDMTLQQTIDYALQPSGM